MERCWRPPCPLNGSEPQAIINRQAIIQCALDWTMNRLTYRLCLGELSFLMVMEIMVVAQIDGYYITLKSFISIQPFPKRRSLC